MSGRDNRDTRDERDQRDQRDQRELQDQRVLRDQRDTRNLADRHLNDRAIDDLFERMRLAELEQSRQSERQANMKEELGRKVGMAEFLPVKLIAFGGAGIVLAGFVGLIMRLVGMSRGPIL